MSISFQPSMKLTITTLEGPAIAVTAMYNPKDLDVQKAAPWTKAPSSKGDQPDLEFTAADGRSMSFELWFDTYESGGDVHAMYVANLVRMAMVMDPDGDEEKKRPPKVQVLWGTLPPFRGVIESVGTKYTMFLPTGIPVRATCTVKIKEADKLSFKKGDGGGGGGGGGGGA
ncbi:MAG: hypothetical protein HS111_31555 [Kofleriaceae bacterium]|nr:hypothetical protein [Kofleriaceae bacterium]MCL4228237.1 hypothetical protein [Myxococcales bacterium]